MEDPDNPGGDLAHIRFSADTDSDTLKMERKSTTGMWSMTEIATPAHLTRDPFRSFDPMWSALGSGDTVLIQGSWVVEKHKSGENKNGINRRQDLSKLVDIEPFWKHEELSRKVESLCVRIVALSLCWASAAHPDPEGEQFRFIADMVKKRLAHADVVTNLPIFENLAMFWDWCSLYQQPRTEEQEEGFKKSFSTMGLWYANQYSEVWLLTKVPNGTKAYTERGWPTFEQTISGVTKEPKLFIDLGKWDEKKCPTWKETCKECTAARKPLLVPKTFWDLLNKKVFTDSADRVAVFQIYEKTFTQMGDHTELMTFDNPTWGLPEAEALAATMPLIKRLKEVNAEGFPFGCDGLIALAPALSTLVRLETITMMRCGIGDKGAVALAKQIPKMLRLKQMNLMENKIGHEGSLAIKDAWKKESKDSEMLLLS